jgi:hypothetical protein
MHADAVTLGEDELTQKKHVAPKNPYADMPGVAA